MQCQGARIRTSISLVETWSKLPTFLRLCSLVYRTVIMTGTEELISLLDE